MNDDYTAFENLLREFEPQPAHPFRETASPAWRLQRLAAAVVVTIAVLGSGWLALRKPSATSNTPLATANSTARSNPPNFSLLRLTHLALENPEALERELEARSRTVSLRLSGQSGALHRPAVE
jgi:ferric-dicitrate binding protein FerR (iron transport regulator)